MHRKRLYFLICTFLCISSSLGAQEGAAVAPGVGPGVASGVAPELAAALCEMQWWQSESRTQRDSLLAAKAAFLLQADECSRAYASVCRIPSYGLSAGQRAELLRLKLLYSYSAGLIDEFAGMLDEAAELGLLDEAFELDGKPARRSEDAAMILSVIPGAGLAYAGDWKNAGKYFLLNSSIIALGVGAYLSELYLATFLGGGMLLYTTLPRSTEMAIQAAADYNKRALMEYYKPVYDMLLREGVQ